MPKLITALLLLLGLAPALAQTEIKPQIWLAPQTVIGNPTGGYAPASAIPYAELSGGLNSLLCPTATLTQAGCVKPDGTSITVSAGVLSVAAGYLKGTASGNTTEFATVSGALTNGHCPAFNNGNLIDGGGPCVSSSSGVTAGTANQAAYYASTGSVVSGISAGQIPFLTTGATTTRLGADIANDHGINIRNFGAVGDGGNHPLSGIYGSLAAAQAVYPFVSDLTQEVDWAATQATENYVHTNGNDNTTYCPPVMAANESYVLSNPIIINPTGIKTYTAWATGTTYANAANAEYNGLPWVSLGSGNVGNPPTTTDGYPAGLRIAGNPLPFANVTISDNSPAVITLANHGFSAGRPLIFLPDTYDGGAALPTGINANQVYYVIATGLTTNTFEVSATPGGSAINTSSAGTGVFTVSTRVWDLAIASTQFSDQGRLVGQPNVPGNSGCIFSFASTTAPAIVYLPGNGNYIANINILGPGVLGSGTYRCQTPTESVGIGTPTNGGGPSRTLLDRVGSDGFYSAWQSNIPNGQGVLGDSTTLIKGNFSDSCNGADITGTQNFINSSYDTNFSQDNTAVSDFAGTHFQVFGGNLSAFGAIWNKLTMGSVSVSGSNVLTATLTNGTNGFPDSALDNPLCGYNLQCGYGIFNIVSARYGIVPWHITAFNPATQQITLALNSDWAASYDNTGPGADFATDIEAQTLLYATETVTVFLGGGINAHGPHIENGPPTTLANAGLAFGSNSPLLVESPLFNINGVAAGTDICCNQSPGDQDLARFFGQQNTAWIIQGEGSVVLDSPSGGYPVQANSQERAIIIGSGGEVQSEFRHTQPFIGSGVAYNNRSNAGGAASSNSLSGNGAAFSGFQFGIGYGQASTGFGAGLFDNPVAWTSFANTYADAWRSQLWGSAPTWGVRPAPYSNPCVTPAQEAALASPAAITYTSTLNWIGINSGGTSYQVGDVVTLVGGTSSTAATVRVTQVGGSGQIQQIGNTGPQGQTNNGSNNTYTVEASTFTATGGHGSSATFNNPIWYVSYTFNYPMLWGGVQYHVCDWSIAPTAYDSGTTYPQGALVTSSAVTYVSLVNSNVGNTPASSPSDWAVFKYALLSNNTGYSYFQNLTGTNVPNLAWLMTIGSQQVYMNQEALELMFPGLVITLTPGGPCSGSAINFIIQEVHPNGGGGPGVSNGYVTAQNTAAQTGGDPNNNAWGGGNGSICTGTTIAQAAPNIVNPY